MTLTIPPVGPSFGPQRVIKTYLHQSDEHWRSGRHNAAITVGQRALAKSESNADPLMYWAMADIARNRLRLGNEAGALECIAGIPDEARRSDTALDSECWSIHALVKKRYAHRAWKGMEIEKAEKLLSEARDCFQIANITAHFRDQSTRLNAALNELYCEGMSAAMRGFSETVNPDLIVKAVSIERIIRENSPPSRRDDVTAMTMIADLALGCRMRPRDVLGSMQLCASDRDSLDVVLGAGESSWVDLIFESIRVSRARPSVVARGLTVAVRTAVQQLEKEQLRSSLLRLALALQTTLLDIQAETQRETGVTGAVREHIRLAVETGGFPFTGRRMLR